MRRRVRVRSEQYREDLLKQPVTGLSEVIVMSEGGLQEVRGEVSRASRPPSVEESSHDKDSGVSSGFVPLLRELGEREAHKEARVPRTRLVTLSKPPTLTQDPSSHQNCLSLTRLDSLKVQKRERNKRKNGFWGKPCYCPGATLLDGPSLITEITELGWSRM